MKTDLYGYKNSYFFPGFGSGDIENPNSNVDRSNIEYLGSDTDRRARISGPRFIPRNNTTSSQQNITTTEKTEGTNVCLYNPRNAK